MITSALQFAETLEKTIDRHDCDFGDLFDRGQEWNKQPASVRHKIKDLVHNTRPPIIREWLSCCALDYATGWWVLRLYADSIKANKFSVKAAYADYSVYAQSGLIPVTDMPPHDIAATKWAASTLFTQQFTKSDLDCILVDGGFDGFVTIDLFENHVLVDRVIEEGRWV